MKTSVLRLLGCLAVLAWVVWTYAGEAAPAAPRSIAEQTIVGRIVSDLPPDVVAATTTGSSSCPDVPVALDVVAGTAVVTLADRRATTAEACTADLVVTTHVLRLPPGVTRADVRAVELVADAR